MTLVVLYNQQKVLLAMKKRGFGAGRWNGYGGKVQEESIRAAALRELEEESGINGVELIEGGVIRFIFPEKQEELKVHLFRNSDFHGEAIETEEMRPSWFLHSEIPFDLMWPDDPFWLPQFLVGENIDGTIWFSDENTIIKKEIKKQRV